MSQQWYVCSDCQARGRMDELIHECPVCGGELTPTEAPVQRFVLVGKAKEVFEKLDRLIADINKLQQQNTADTKKLQLEATLPDVFVICPQAKTCSLNGSCYHAKPHEPLEFEHTTCRHYSACLEYTTRCIPIEPEI